LQVPRLEQIDDSLWLVEGERVSFYGFPYPTRAVIVRLHDHTLWVWSPVGLTRVLREQIDRLGEVAHLVSPNRLHHLHLREWSGAYPSASVWGPASTIRRHPELSFCAPLTDMSPSEWGGDIDQAWFLGSMIMDEVVFLHRPSATVIVADLIEAFGESFLRAHWRWWQRPLARIGGIVSENPGAPLDWRWSFVDLALAQGARAKALSWHCERVIIAHGEWQRSEGSEFLRRGLAWLGRSASSEPGRVSTCG
jgi:hypothetical protein